MSFVVSKQKYEFPDVQPDVEPDSIRSRTETRSSRSNLGQHKEYREWEEPGHCTLEKGHRVRPRVSLPTPTSPHLYQRDSTQLKIQRE